MELRNVCIKVVKDHKCAIKAAHMIYTIIPFTFFVRKSAAWILCKISLYVFHRRRLFGVLKINYDEIWTIPLKNKPQIVCVCFYSERILFYSMCSLPISPAAMLWASSCYCFHLVSFQMLTQTNTLLVCSCPHAPWPLCLCLRALGAPAVISIILRQHPTSRFFMRALHLHSHWRIRGSLCRVSQQASVHSPTNPTPCLPSDSI